MFHSLLIYLADPTPTPAPSGGFNAPGAEPPPGSDKLSTLLAWGLWIATGLLIAAVIKAGVQIALASHGRGGGGEHGVTLLMSLVGAVICGVAAAAVSLLLA